MITQPFKRSTGMAKDVKIPLNPQVAKEVRDNLELWLVFSDRFQGYDWEIDPLHRESWVLETQKREAKLLDEAKAKLAELKKVHEQLINGSYDLG